MTKKTLRKSSS